MKARYVIMIMIVILVGTIVVNLKEEKNVKSLTCSVDSDFHGMDSVITLNVKVKASEIKDIDMRIDVKIPEEYIDQKEYLISSIEADGKMDVSSTEDGIELKTDMRGDYFKSLGLNTNTSIGEFRQALEFQGYTCE